MVRKNLLKGLVIPHDTDYVVKEEETTPGANPTYGRFVAYPFERGMGTTVGNALRRVLLSSIQGYAVSAIKFTVKTSDGTTHQVSNEFESIEGVKEDIAEIIAAFKKFEIKANEDDEDKTIVFVVEAKGPKTLTGADFEKAGIEIMNKDIHVLTLEKGVELDIEVQIDLGRGYVPGELGDKYKEQYGVLPIDALYSPVKRVRYKVDPTRVGQRSDYDKLTFEVFTDGTVSPTDAVAQAAHILNTYLSAFVNFDPKAIVSNDTMDENDARINNILNTSVDVLELSVRSSNCLRRANINTLYDLTQKSEYDIAKERNFGKKSLLEIKDKLKEWGLGFNMKDYSTAKVPKHNLPHSEKEE